MALFNKIKTSMATTEGKLKAFLIVIGVTMLIGLLSAGTFAILGTPRYCQLCHEMKPEYVTWQAGAHSKFSCLDCHVERQDPKYAIKAATVEVYQHFTGQVSAPIQTEQQFDSKVCEDCHSSNRVVTPPGDIKIPHATHKAHGIKCLDCHSAIAHANIAESGFTVKRIWDKWNGQVGKAYMEADFLRLSMNDCIDCHKSQGSGPTDNCNACHTKFVKPTSHSNADFINKHGIEAFRNIDQCDKCHKTTKTDIELRTNIDDPVILYARQNTFCAGCHTTKKPSSHGTDWGLAHKVPASFHREYCLVCHDEALPTKDTNATKTGCGKCHTSLGHSLNLKMHSIKNYPLPPKPTITPACARCHSEESCRKCHYLPWPSSSARNSDADNSE